MTMKKLLKDCGLLTDEECHDVWYATLVPLKTRSDTLMSLCVTLTLRDPIRSRVFRLEVTPVHAEPLMLD